MRSLIIDVEATNKLWYWADLICVGIKDLGKNLCTTFYPKDSSVVEKTITESDIVLIGHNIKYDLLVLKKNGIKYNQKAFLVDTAILSGLVDNRGSHKLVDLCIKYKIAEKGIYFDDLLKGEKKKRIDISQIPIEKIVEKNKQDLDYTEKLFNYFKSAHPEIDNRYKDLEEPFLKILIDLEWRGINVSSSDITSLLERYETEYKNREEKLKEVFKDINFNSPKQLGKFFFEKREAIKKTAKGNIAMDEEVLKELSLTEKVASDLLEARKLKKIIKTYIHGILKYKVNGRVHPSFIQHVDIGKGTSTGRLSCVKPNMQNFPEHSKAREIKKVFVPSDGMVFINADYSQIELRLFSHYSKDKTLVDAFKNNLDLHDLTARELFGKTSISSLERYIGKTFNFAMGFGAWVDTLMRTLKKDLPPEEYIKISEEQIKNLVFKYWRRFQGLKNWIDNMKTSIKSRGYSETILGKKRYFDDPSSNDSQREGLNSVIQGSAADLLKYSVVKLYKYPEIRPINFVHDSIIYEVPKDRAKEFAFKIKRDMIQSGVDLKLSVPIRVKITIGNSMAEV